ncbi:nucleoside/nucleotide kinase family protein [Actinokineospora auranticolor]|uniref:Phosphoribulokinase/uridine kinase family protein n=1 Tax=Actinokineospora auranticolor TaxID=155976 RepID=A0A2S6GRT8_9PSEU|nr:nucleoside/nucleotide kinase family protein [Actinokineospora auranticolor]PPK67930.1 phosphoribulokinase/uridine kinase family protein [Actinokineospora auranticolor]
MNRAVTFADLRDRAVTMAAAGGRRILGICGAPGVGKTTLAARLVDALGERARLVGMDGFHLAHAELARLGRVDRKGAPDTFDADGYANLLHRLRANTDPVVYAPEFRREVEEPIAGAVAVGCDVPLVVTEGNYLLLWPRVRPLLDEVWFLDPGDELRRARLLARHMAYGRTREQAAERTGGSDERNAELVATTAATADLVLRKIE